MGTADSYYNLLLFKTPGLVNPNSRVPSGDFCMMEEAIKFYANEAPNKLYRILQTPTPDGSVLAPVFDFIVKSYMATFIIAPNHQEILSRKHLDRSKS